MSLPTNTHTSYTIPQSPTHAHTLKTLLSFSISSQVQSDLIWSDQSLSCVRLFSTPWIAARQASLSITNSQNSLRLMSNQVSDAIQPCHPLLSPSPLAPNPSKHPPSIRVFSNESTLLMRWPKYWSFSFSIIPSKEIPGLISFRMDWLDLLALVAQSCPTLCDPRL